MLIEAGLNAAAAAVSEEWMAMVAEMSPHMSPGESARSFVAPGNHRLLRAGLTAYLATVQGAPTHRHVRRGSLYTVVGEARAQCSTRPIRDGEMLVLYRGQDGVYSVRVPEEFADGRFETLPPSR